MQQQIEQLKDQLKKQEKLASLGVLSAGIAHERGKGIIVAVNKWDAVEKDDKTIYRQTEKISFFLLTHLWLVVPLRLSVTRYFLYP